MRYIPRGYTKEDLRKMYLEQNMRREDIAKRYNISISCVDKDVQKYGFRKSKELISAQFEKKVDTNALYQYYIVENHTNDQTAQHFKIDERTLRRKMRKYGIIKSQEQQLEALKREQFKKYAGIRYGADYSRLWFADSRAADESAGAFHPSGKQNEPG